MTIYLKCRVGGLGILSPAQKGNNKYTFAKCPYRGNTGFFTTESELVMRFGENGINPKQVNQPGQVMYPFFQTIPRRYFELSDITTIQGNSYKYQVTGLVGQMFTKCEGSSTISRRLEEVKPKRRVSCGVRGAQQEAIPNEVINATNYAPQYYTSGQSEKEHEQAAYDPAQNFPIFWDKNHQESIVIDEQATVQVTAWADEVKSHLQSAKLNHTEAVSSFSGSAPSEYGSSQLEHEEAHELEKMVCMFYDQCRGGVKDYTEEFKKSFGVKGPPPCKRIVDEIKSGLNNGLKLSNWKELMEKYFPCNVSIDQTSYIGADLPDSENENDEAGSGLMDSSSAESDYTVNDDSTFEDEDEDEFVVSKVPGENTTELVPQPSAAFNTILPNGSAIPDMPSTSPIPLRIDTSPSPVSASASGSGVGSVESPSTNSN
jgi:hypothetical protein